VRRSRGANNPVHRPARAARVVRSGGRGRLLRSYRHHGL